MTLHGEAVNSALKRRTGRTSIQQYELLYNMDVHSERCSHHQVVSIIVVRMENENVEKDLARECALMD